MIEVGESSKVFVLRHPTKGTAFVRTSDVDRVGKLVDGEGYEVVARQTEDGVEPVMGDVVPEEVARSEALSAARTAGARDGLDVGVGLNLGFTSGGKVRVLATLGPGLVVGVDLDAGTVLFFSDLSLSGVLGWSFEAGRHIIRPYVLAGAAVLSPSNSLQGPVGAVHAGFGIEWKPARWVGLGLEAGLNIIPPQGTGDGGGLPWARLCLTFYFL